MKFNELYRLLIRIPLNVNENCRNVAQCKEIAHFIC